MRWTMAENQNPIMKSLSKSELFDGVRVPFRVRELMAVTPSGKVTAEAVKVVYGISGNARIISQQGTTKLGTGTVMTIPAGLECAGFPEGHARTVTFYFHPDYLEAELRWLSQQHPLVHLLDRAVNGRAELGALSLSRDMVQQLVPRLLRMAALDRSDEDDFLLLSEASKMAALIGRYCGSSQTGRRSSSTDWVRPRPEVATTIALLRQHPEYPWSLQELASRILLSTSQFSRVFREQTGISPAAYLRHARADRMAELLATTSLTIGEAAAKVGWSDPAVASRSFKKRYGVPPRVYADTYRTEPTVSRALDPLPR